MSRSKSAERLKSPQVLVVGFCKDAAGEAILTASGIPPRAIYMDGRNGENLTEAKRKFRDGDGIFAVPSDLRLLGPSSNAVAAEIAWFEKRGIRIVDVTQPELVHAELQDLARKAISGNRFHDPRRAKRVGAKGGVRKGVAASERRNASVCDDIARAVCAAPELTLKRKAQILGMPVSTIKRHYFRGTTTMLRAVAAGTVIYFGAVAAIWFGAEWCCHG